MNTELYLELKDNEYEYTSITHNRLIARAVVIDDENNYYFVKGNRDDDFGKCITIETSGGGIEENETPEQAIHRELKEELGVEVEIIRKIGIVSDYYNLIHRHNINHYFLCKITSFGKKQLTEDEKNIFHLSTLKLSYEKTLEEYQKHTDSPLGRLLYQREVPILKESIQK